MNFADLYRVSNGLSLKATPFKVLKEHVIAFHPKVGDVETWGCVLDEQVSLGHITYEEGRSSAYGEPYDVAVIKVSKKLNRCWRRFVCCKELMHVFDDSSAKTSDEQKFLLLLKELETTPLPGDASPMLDSEANAEWMALLALCPQRLRDEFAKGYVKSTDADAAIADRLKIPAILVQSLMSDYYWRALEKLTGDTGKIKIKKGSPPVG